MKKNSNASKEVTRDKKIEIRMTEEEKELWYEYAKDIGINPSRLARNILMIEAESILNKLSTKPIAKAYIKTMKLLKDKEFIERMKSD
ncbi:MAG TPA: hypothetical protein ENK75_01375 [Saprospiraceae bacterium]|nr:hypothetical protein [Saprospiraceae bacterium]